MVTPAQLQVSHLNSRDITLLKMLTVCSTYPGWLVKLSLNVGVPLSVITYTLPNSFVFCFVFFLLLQIILSHSPISFALQIYPSFSSLNPSLFCTGMYINLTGELGRIEVRSSSRNPVIPRGERASLRTCVCVSVWCLSVYFSVHAFNQYSLRSHYYTETVLGSRNTNVN